MSSPLPQPRGVPRLRFDVYEVDPRAGELRKHGFRVPLEARPFRALQILLEHAPELVTREELQQQLWPSDVFVDFDHGLNKAIGKVRRALNDSADQPRFVETVGGHGYRFIAALEPEKDFGIAGIAVALPAPEVGEATGSDREKEKTKRGSRPLLIAAAAISAVLFLAFLFRPVTPRPRVVRITQVTKSGEAWPLEPMATDGPRLYYQSLSQSLSHSESAANWRVKQVLLNGNEESVIPGTSDRIHSFRIRGLSSDDTEFLALTRIDGGKDWMAATLPVVGGLPRRVGNLLVDDVAWAHDGSMLAYTRGHQLFVCNPDGTGSRMLSSLPGDIEYLTWSPDDRRLDFTLVTEQQALWEVGARTAAVCGSGASIFWERRWNVVGRGLRMGIYTLYSARSAKRTSNLWAVEEKSAWWRRGNREAVQLTFGPMNYYQPLPSRNGKTIYAIWDVGVLENWFAARGSRKAVFPRSAGFLPIIWSSAGMGSGSLM